MGGGDDVTVRDDPDERRYELLLDGARVGELVYRADGETLSLLHKEVDRSLEGRGLGSALVGRALDDIRSRGLRIVPLCPFVGDYIERHPEYADLVAGGG